MIPYAIHVVIFVGIVSMKKMVSLFRVQKTNPVLITVSDIVMILNVVYTSLNLTIWIEQ